MACLDEPPLGDSLERSSFIPCMGHRSILTKVGWRVGFSSRASVGQLAVATILVSVADAMTDLMVGARVAPRSKFTTIYSGMEVEPLLHADDHRKEMRQQLGFADHHVVFGKIARLFHLKGHEYLIEAARLMADDLPDVRFLLVGDGILRKPFEDRIAKLGLSDRFVFTGLVPPESIPRYLGAMDALVHTSLREGLARALPQALIAGKPVISYDIDGAREVIIDGETGYLLRPKPSNRCRKPFDESL